MKKDFFSYFFLLFICGTVAAQHSEDLNAVTLDLEIFHANGTIDETDLRDDFLHNGIESSYDSYKLTLPVDGTYRISSAGFTGSNFASFIHLYSDAPVRNSGLLMSRPEFIGYQAVFPNGESTAKTLDFNLKAGTYYLDFVAGGMAKNIAFYDIAMVLDAIAPFKEETKEPNGLPIKTILDEAAVAGDNLGLSSVQLYPNPVENIVNLSNQANAKLASVSVHDLTGRLVAKQIIENNTNFYRFDLSHLTAASYLVVIQGENGSITRKLIKE